MKECRKYENILARYLHGDALLQDRERLEKHLAMCPDCERLYGEISDVDTLLRELPGKQVEPPAYLLSRIIANLPEDRPVPLWKRWWRSAAAGAVFACGAAAAVAIYLAGVPKETRVATAPPPVPAPVSRGAAPDQYAGTTGVPAIRSAPGPRPDRAEKTVVAPAPKVQVIQQVKIFFYYPPAQKVAVTGDFNNWHVDGVPMHASGKPGLWATELRLPPGVYSYNFIVDGELLLPDPNAPDQMPDGYGGTNSILLVREEGAI